MKDRRKTRFRSDLKVGDLVAKHKGWFIPFEPKPWGNIWGVWNGEEIRPYVNTSFSDQLVYFSGSGEVSNWEKDNKYIELAPKGKLITKFSITRLISRCINYLEHQIKTR